MWRFLVIAVSEIWEGLKVALAFTVGRWIFCPLGMHCGGTLLYVKKYHHGWLYQYRCTVCRRGYLKLEVRP